MAMLRLQWRTLLWRVSARGRHHSAADYLPAQSITYEQFGNPAKVLQLDEHRINTQLKPGQVLVGWLAAPVNPADLNMVQGVYPIKPPLPAVGGNEGVAEVMAVADNVVCVQPGDWVIPAAAGGGTWQTHSLLTDHQLLKLSHKMPVEQAATLMVNPHSAYRMLKDFVKLRPGDHIIQNGANSAVGRYVIQIARLKHYKTINVIRDKSDKSEVERLKRELSELGADHVLTESELRRSGRALVSTLPKLALNCVGGESTLSLASHLREGGHLVTYGGMSRRPVQVPTAALIFKRIQLHGFWMSHWYSLSTNRIESARVLDWIESQVQQGGIAMVPFERVPFTEYRQAVQRALDQSGPKQLLVFDKRFTS